MSMSTIQLDCKYEIRRKKEHKFVNHYLVLITSSLPYETNRVTSQGLIEERNAVRKLSVNVEE